MEESGASIANLEASAATPKDFAEATQRVQLTGNQIVQNSLAAQLAQANISGPAAIELLEE